MDWRRSSDLADRGYAAAEALKDKLLPLAVDEATFDAFQAARQARRRDVSKGVPEFLTVIGVDAREEAFIRETLAPVLGMPLDNETIVDRILTVTGTDRYEYLTYRPIREGRQARPRDQGAAEGLRPAVPPGQPRTHQRQLEQLLGEPRRPRRGLRLGGHRLGGAHGWRRRHAPRPRRSKSGGRWASPRCSWRRVPTTSRRHATGTWTSGSSPSTASRGPVADSIWASPPAATRKSASAWTSPTSRAGSASGRRCCPRSTARRSSATLSFVWDNQTSPVVPTKGHYIKNRLRYYFGAPEQTGGTRRPIDSPQEFWQGEVTGSWFTRVRREDRFFVNYGIGSSFGDQPLDQRLLARRTAPPQRVQRRRTALQQLRARRVSAT